MSFLLDTNVLLRSAEPSHPMYEEAVNATNTLLGRGEELWLAPQNLIEFWNVYTRPVERNGLGHTVTEASTEVNRLKNFSLCCLISLRFMESGNVLSLLMLSWESTFTMLDLLLQCLCMV